jgi:hypothetical protein
MSEFVIILLFSLLQFGIAALFYVRWLRRMSLVTSLKTDFLGSVRARLQAGTLAEYLQAIAEGRISVLPRRKSRPWLLLTGGVMLSGIALMFIIRLIFPGMHIALRVVVALISVTPFMALLGIAIAQETDDIKIADFVKVTNQEMLLKIDQGSSLAEYLEKLEHQPS